MDSHLTFQERCEAFAARRGRFVDMHEDDDSSSLRSPVASVAASFDTLDEVADDYESGGVGAAGIGDLCVPSTAAGAASSSTNPTEAFHPRARGMPSTVVRAGMITSTSDSRRSRMRSLTLTRLTTLWTTRGSSMHASKYILFEMTTTPHKKINFCMRM